jgi:hypothetical protein
VELPAVTDKSTAADKCGTNFIFRLCSKFMRCVTASAMLFGCS